MSRAAPDVASVAVVGAGAWGTALAVILGARYPDVLLWVLEEHLASSRSVAEGVNACRSTLLLARMHGIEMPICQGVHRVLFGGQDPRQVVPELMARDLKFEDA